MKEFLNPKNFGEFKKFDGSGEVGSPQCGDIMQLQIKVKDEKIVGAKFKTYGCGAAIASTSIITQMVKGKTLSYAKKITMQDVARKLQGLPQIKMHCSSMGIMALRKAIEDYEGRKKK